MAKTVDGGFGPVPRKNRRYKRHTKGTYIGLIAYIIQDSPSKMLTFKQIMIKLAVFITGDKKGLENNIRVCLSSNKCFVKVPIDPEYPNAKRNFWKVDESSITPKMLRRHFSDMAELFPGLPPALARKPVTPPPPPAPVPSAPVCPVKMEDRPIKFSGPFSIESLLKKAPVPQVRAAGAAQTALSTNLCFSDHFYNKTASAGSLACFEQQNRQHGLCSMYRPAEEAGWRKPVQRMDYFPPELHPSLLYAPAHYPYDQPQLTAASSSHTGSGQFPQ